MTQRRLRTIAYAAGAGYATCALIVAALLLLKGQPS